MELRYSIVDAFTDHPFGGNPAGVVLLDGDVFPPEKLMLQFAAEHDGVAFEDLPDDWKCPRCKQGKEKFNRA